MRETVEFLLFVAFVGMLLVLRLDAFRFGTAEYDDELRHGGWRGWLRRLTWYALAIALVLLTYWLYPQPISVLHLDLGPDRSRVLFLGLGYGIAGTLVAFVFAWLRYRRFRLPAARVYPGALVNSVATAFIDEALFRGVMMGLLLHWSWPPALAIAFETIVYALATRLGAPGRSRVMLVIIIGIGAAGGFLVNETLGIGAAVLGHAITRFAIFLATGHPGQVRPTGWEPEEVAGWALPPSGWDYVGDDQGPTPGGSGPPGMPPPGFVPGGFVLPGGAYAPQGPMLPPGAYGGPPPSGPPQPWGDPGYGGPYPPGAVPPTGGWTAYGPPPPDGGGQGGYASPQGPGQPR